MPLSKQEDPEYSAPGKLTGREIHTVTAFLPQRQVFSVAAASPYQQSPPACVCSLLWQRGIAAVSGEM